MKMMELTELERHLLLQILQEEVSGLRQEIARTDSHDFKQALKDKRSALIQIAAKLSGERQPVN